MKKTLAILLLLLSACPAISQAQHADSLLIKKDSLALSSLSEFFTHEDSLDIFDLIDSLLKMEPMKGTSMIGARLGYNSNVIADNRTFNISQFGLAPGVSYYHKSGLYADYSAYWSQEYKPNFYLSIASMGYLHSITKWYSVLGEYSHYFYNQAGDSTVSVPYTNNVGLSNYFQVKRAVFRLDYYFYFGDKVAHRIMPSLGVNLVKRKWKGLDRISFYPTFNVLFGTEEVVNYELYPDFLDRVRYNRTNTPRKPLVYERKHTEFGVMNYSISTPISITKKDWTFLVSYTYNIPKPLPGEDLSLQSGGYVSFSVTRYFNFKSSK